MRKPLFYVFFILAIAGCKKTPQKTTDTITPPPPPAKELQFFIESAHNPGKLTENEVMFTMAGDSAAGIVPDISNQKKFALTFSPSTADVKIDGVAQKSGETINDFTKPVNYTFTNLKGEIKTIKVSVTNFTGIPIFYLTTAGPVVSKDDYITGSLSVNPNGQFGQDTSAISLQIKGRGNSTWGLFPKKPYKMKFNKKAPLLGLPAAKNWVLLANFSDKTLLRNAIAFDMGHQFGADFTPHYRFVEVVMNGLSLGNYTLTEQVEVNPGRVNIADLSPANTEDSDITGGYLLELDQRLDADKYILTPHGLPITINTPDDITDKQLDYIRNYLQQTENAMFAPDFADPVNGYAKYINVDSFIDWYLVKELMKDNDGLDFSSIYYYKDTNGKLGMGPVWDFDLAAGNTNYSDCSEPTGWWIRNAVWFSHLFKDPAFAAKVKTKWQQMKTSAIPFIMANIDKNAAYINASQQANFKTWPILTTLVWPNVVALGNYGNEVDYVKNWLNTRIAWMDANM